MSTKAIPWLAAASVVALNAFAAGETAPAGPATDAADEQAGSPLDSICNACGIVTDVRSEQRPAGPPDTKPAAVTGAVTGAVIGHRIGNGKVLYIVAGAAAGGVAGNEAARRAAPRTTTVWFIAATFKDGTQRRFQLDEDPRMQPGDVVRVYNGQPYKP